MKQVLFVINTLGCAGAETAMIEMIRNMAKSVRNDSPASQIGNRIK